MEPERPPIEDTATRVDRVRFALADNSVALAAFEKILGDYRLATDEATKLRGCPLGDCVEKLVEVTCRAGHTSREP